MKYILAISGSNSKNSINSSLLNYIVESITIIPTQRVDLLQHTIPIYNIDIEQEDGIPLNIVLLKHKIKDAAGIIIAVNEHNGMISAFFKNILDWLSRADRNFLASKHILLVSTSPGGRGASLALDYMKKTIPRFGGTVSESFSFPSFQKNFDSTTKEITNSALEIGITQVVASFLQQLDF